MSQKADAPTFSIARTFDAPREKVWAAWADARALGEWWGPKGFDIEVRRLEFRTGGIFLYRMSTGSQEMWGRFVYREIAAPERLVFVSSFSDSEGNLARGPFFDGRWPLEVLNTMTLVERDGRTELSLRAAPIDATPDEEDAFVSNFKSMEGALSRTFEQLAACLRNH